MMSDITLIDGGLAQKLKSKEQSLGKVPKQNTNPFRSEKEKMYHGEKQGQRHF